LRLIIVREQNCLKSIALESLNTEYATSTKIFVAKLNSLRQHAITNFHCYYVII
jgi:hypothetical protein